MQQNERTTFTEKSIGKSKVKIPISQKQQAQAKVAKDIQELEPGISK